MPEHVTILGAGAMGTVCSMLLIQAGHSVRIWGARPDSIARLQENRELTRLLPGAKIPESVELTSHDPHAFDAATLILSALPTQYMRSAWLRLAPHYRGQAVVSVSKGIEIETLLRPTEIIADVLKSHPSAPPCGGLAVLSGPNIAGELARSLPATAVVASADPELAKRVQSVFLGPYFRVYTNQDLIGVELAGATKNIIAIAAGILDGMGAGNNAKAMLVTRGLVEITRLGVALGARPETFMGLAGLGDLLTTCVSPEGRNRFVGERIGRGETLEQILATTASVAEGVPTTRSVLQLAARLGVEMPITEMLHEILFSGKNARAALAELMGRGAKSER